MICIFESLDIFLISLVCGSEHVKGTQTYFGLYSLSFRAISYYGNVIIVIYYIHRVTIFTQYFYRTAFNFYVFVLDSCRGF
jgi:hypothetical protein